MNPFESLILVDDLGRGCFYINIDIALVDYERILKWNDGLQKAF